LAGASKKEAAIEPNHSQTDAPERTTTHLDNREPTEGDTSIAGKDHTEEEADREEKGTCKDSG
jgi:hypothetical protein